MGVNKKYYNQLRDKW